MATPFFRASQTSSQSPFAHTTITLPRLEIKPQERFDISSKFNPSKQTIPSRLYVFTDLTVENGESYSPPLPTVRWITRLVAVPVNRKKQPIGEPHWFSVHIYWDVVLRDGLAKWNAPRHLAIAYESHARICDYLTNHPYPAYSEEYDPIVLEVW